MMSLTQYIVIFYILFWPIRINGCLRRWRQPLLRGREWFFNVHVQSGFYEGAGKKILRGYFLRMFVPFAVDIPLATTIFLSGHLLLLQWLVVGLALLIHANHYFSVSLAERQARRFAVPEAEQPVAAVVLPLKTPRLRDYTNHRLQVAMVLATLLGLGLLVRYYFAAPEHHNLRQVFQVPAVLLYMQAGVLFAKRLVLAWRTPVPQDQAEEHLQAREERRKLYIKQCDWTLVCNTIVLLFWPMALSASPSGREHLTSIFLAAWLAMAVVLTIWVEIKRKELLRVALRVRPVKLPDLLGNSGISGWPVCYQPSAPMLLLRSSRGYSLNFAHALAQVGTAYMAGLIVLMVLLERMH
ncbi:MAG TPA: hypothetical protein VKY85_06020 [Candidatus Angelobacter sp.]|nr:hypothetical protein [Candidatus Angelobacter sp.]